MTITYSIRNVTSELVHTVMIRKFFQMVFIGDDKKSLHIYTATVLGAQKDKIECNHIESDKKGAESSLNSGFNSELDEVKSFRMKFDFAVGKLDDNEVFSIEHEDITLKQNIGFLDEVDCIRNVWGDKCKVILNDQNELLEKYKKVYPEWKKEESKTKESTAMLAGHKVLWTEQKKSGIEEGYFQSLSIAGDFENVANSQKQRERDEIAMRKAYTISVPKNIDIPKGIELVNWVRTTIQFKYAFDDVGHNFLIKKDIGDNSCTFLCPDFTWYFSPIMKSYIDNRNCIVEVKRGAKGSYESCLCPVQKNRRIFYRNDKFQNSINPVPNKLTVNFHYWKDEEKINYRQKYRLAARDIFPKPDDFDDMSEINIFLDTSDEHNRGNRQFIAGIFLSLALAYGIDSGRLEDVEYCFTPLKLIMTADIWWIIFLILFSLTLMNKPVKLSEKSRKMMKRRRVILVWSALWVGVVFGVLRSPLLIDFVEKFKVYIGWGSGIGLIILGGMHVCYLCNKSVKMGRSLLADLFGEDIL